MGLATGVPKRVIAFGVAIVATVALAAVALSRGWVSPQSLQNSVAHSGATGMLLYVLAVAVLEVFWFPRVWGLLAGGLLFGPVVGGLLSIVSDLLSATACYLIARGAAGAWVASLLRSRPKAERIVRLLAHQRGAVVIALLRICPVAHFTLVNYSAGVAGVRPLAFLGGTAIGLIPGAILYPILGDSLFHPSSATFWISLGLLAAGLAISVVYGRKLLAE